MRIVWLLVLILMGGAVLADDMAHRLTAEQWAISRSAASVVTMPALSRALQDFQASPGGRLEIRYPGGVAGSQWAQELRHWLIALGVPSTDLEMVSGSANHDSIDLRVVFDPRRQAPIVSPFIGAPVETGKN